LFTAGGRAARERVTGWWTRRREQRENFSAMAQGFPELRDMVRVASDAAQKCTGQIRAIDARLTGQDKVLATLLAMTLGEFEASPVPKFVCDASGRNMNVNAAYAALLGVGREDLLDFRWRSNIPADVLEPYLARFQSAVRDHRKFEDEIPMRTVDGRTIRLRVHMLPFPPDEAPATHWVGILAPVGQVA
jgi:PAS domain S-box-containing protein